MSWHTPALPVWNMMIGFRSRPWSDQDPRVASIWASVVFYWQQVLHNI